MDTILLKKKKMDSPDYSTDMDEIDDTNERLEDCRIADKEHFENVVCVLKIHRGVFIIIYKGARALILIYFVSIYSYYNTYLIL